MAIFTAPGYYSGRSYQFNITGDAPTVEEEALIDAHVRQYEQDYRRWYEDQGVEMPSDKPGLGAIPAQIAAGATEGLGSMAQGILGIASPIVPDVIERPAEQGIRGATRAASEYFAPQTLDQPGIINKAARGVGSTLPYLIPVAGPAGRVGRAGQMLMSAGLGALSGAGEARERALQAGAAYTPEGYMATLGGAGIGTLEAVPIAGLGPLPGLVTAMKKNPTVARAVGSRIFRAFRAGGEEAAQEAASEALQNMVEKGFYNPEKEIIAGLGEAATVGGASGMAIQTLLDLFIPGRRRGGTDTGDAQPPTDTAPQDAETLGLPAPDTTAALPAPTEPLGLPAPEPLDRTAPDVVRGGTAYTPPGEITGGYIGQPTLPEPPIYAESEQLPGVVATPEDPGEAKRRKERVRYRTRAAEAANEEFNTAMTAVRAAQEKLNTARAAAAKRPTAANKKAAQNAANKFNELRQRASTAQEKARKAAEQLAKVTAKPQRAPKPVDALVQPEQPTPSPEQPTQPAPRETLTLKGKTPQPATEPTTTAEPVDFRKPVSYKRYGFTRNFAGAKILKDAASTPEDRIAAIQNGLKRQVAQDLELTKSTADKLDAVRDGVRQAHVDLGYTDSPQLAQALEGVPAEDKDRLLTAARIGELGIKPGGKIPGGGALRLNALIDAVNDNPTDPIGAIANSESAKAYVENANFSPEFKSLVKGEPTVETPTAPTAEAKPADTTPETPSAKPEAAKAPVKPEAAKAPRARPRVTGQEAGSPNFDSVLSVLDAFKDADPVAAKAEANADLTSSARSTAAKVASVDAAMTTKPAPRAVNTRSGIRAALGETNAGLKGPQLRMNAAEFARKIQTLIPASVPAPLRVTMQKLSAHIKDSSVTVEVVDDLRNEYGEALNGMYNPQTNTILLDRVRGMDAHTVLHEATHAVTVKAIRDGNETLLAPLRKIYEDLKASEVLVNEPGMVDIAEFAAEIMSNETFRTKVAMARVDTGRLTPLGRVVEAVRDFINSKRAPRRGAEADADILMAVDALMAPAVENIGGASMYALKTPQQFAAQPKQYRQRDQRAVATRTKAGYADQVKDDLMNKVPRSGIYTALGFLNLDTVRRMGKHIPGVESLSRAIMSMEAYVTHLNDRAHVVLRSMVALSKMNREDFDALGAKMTQDTSAQIDSSLTPKQAQKFYGGDPKKMALYKKYRAEYEALSAPAQKLYVQTKEYFRRTFDDLLKVMKASVDTDLVGSPDAAKAIKDSMEKMFKKSVAIHPYFPLFRRDGDYLLMWTEKVTDPVDGTVSQEPVSLKFTTAKMRDAALADLMALESRTPGSVFNVKSVMRNDVAEAFVRPTTGGMTISQIMGVMDTEINKLATNKKLSPEQKVKAEAEAQRVKTQLANTLIDLLPETAIARSLKKRGGADGEGVLGAETMDMIAAFKSKSGGLNRSIAQRRFFNQVEKAKVGLTQHFGVTDTAALAEAPMEPGSPAKDSLATKRAALERAIARDLLRRAELATSVGPSVDKAARRVNQFTFMYMLTSPATSLINLSTIPAIAAPVLGGKYGFSKSWVELMRASRLFTESYGDRTVLAPSGEAGIQEQFTVGESVFDREFSLDNFFDLDEQGNYTVRDKYVQRFKDNPKKLRELQELAPLLTVLEGAGQMRRSTLSEAVLEDDTSQRMNTAMKMLIAPFHMTEQLGRQATAVAAYRLELKRLRDNPPEGVTDAQMQAMAAETALGHALEVNGGAGIHTAPRYAQRGIGRMAFLFKSWALSQVALQARMSFDMFKLIRHQVGLGKLSPEDLAAAKIGVKQMMLMHASIGVMAGAAGMPIYGLIESMYDLLHGDDEEDFGTVAQNYIDNDVIHKGIFTLLGVDVSDRMGLSHLLYRDNPYMSDASVEEHLVALAAGPSWSIAKQAYQASRDFREGNYQRSLEGISPTPLKNLLKAFRIGYAEDGYQTRTGNPIYEDVSAGDVAAQLLGFMPLEYSKVQTQNQFVYRWDKNIREQRERLSKKLYFELYHGGGHDVASVMRKIEKFNRKFPHATIDSDYLKSSFKKRAETEAKMINGLSVSDLNRDALQYYSLISNAAIR